MSWKDLLHQHISEESQDRDMYLELAKQAEAEGCCHQAGVLRDIAHEEHTHHKLLSEMLMDK